MVFVRGTTKIDDAHGIVPGHTPPALMCVARFGQENVFRLQVSVNQMHITVQEIECFKEVLCHLRHAFEQKICILIHEIKQTGTQLGEHDAQVLLVCSRIVVEEGVKDLYAAIVVLSILPLHSFQDVQLELRVFRVLLRGPYNFDCDAALLLPVPGFDNLRKSSLTHEIQDFVTFGEVLSANNVEMAFFVRLPRGVKLLFSCLFLILVFVLSLFVFFFLPRSACISVAFFVFISVPFFVLISVAFPILFIPLWFRSFVPGPIFIPILFPILISLPLPLPLLLPV
mmetsp:Transcript_74476/g.125436  ORF Transcript_74476/g.125436 Transcript_74476/m.125436 type:complete len:284 (+) Transcript_74476:1128-1979(+)